MQVRYIPKVELYTTYSKSNSIAYVSKAAKSETKSGNISKRWIQEKNYWDPTHKKKGNSISVCT